MEDKDSISKFMGVRSMDEVMASTDVIAAPTALQAPPVDPRKDEDFEDARDMVKTILEIGVDAVTEMAEIAKQSQDPGAYEKLGALVNSMTGASKTLLDLHKRKREIDKVEKENPDLKEGAPGEVHNHLYVGSTAELQQFIAKMNNKEEE